MNIVLLALSLASSPLPFAPANAATTIAVAPFSISTDGEQWMASALANGISLRLHRLRKTNSISIRQARSAMRQLGLKPKQLDDGTAALLLARQLGADLLIAGHLEVSGKRAVVRMRIIPTRSKAVGIAHVVTGSVDDPLDLDQRLVSALAYELGERGLRDSPSETRNRSALKGYHQARVLMRAQSFDPRSADPNAAPAIDAATRKTAKDLLNSALEADPNIGGAHAAIAILHALEGDADAAEAAADKAMLLIQNDPRSALARAFVHMRQGRVDKALDSLSSAVRSHPGFLHARGALGLLYAHYGRFREARRIFERYVKAAPNQPWARAQMGYAHARLRKYDAAINATLEALALNPDSPYLLTELAGRHIDAAQYEPALELLEAARDRAPAQPRIHVRLGYVYLLTGDRKRAIEASNWALAVATEIRDSRERGYAHINLARAYGQQKSIDEAITHLKEAKAAGVRSWSEIESDPQLTRLRSDPRYQEIVD